VSRNSSIRAISAEMSAVTLCSPMETSAKHLAMVASESLTQAVTAESGAGAEAKAEAEAEAEVGVSDGDMV
jgi:hypothetical protein